MRRVIVALVALVATGAGGAGVSSAQTAPPTTTTPPASTPTTTTRAPATGAGRSGPIALHDMSEQVASLAPRASDATVQELKTRGYLVPDPAGLDRAKRDAAARAGPRTGTAGATAQPLAPAVSPSWQGAKDPNWAPSDSTGAIGPSRYVELVNSQFAIYDRTGSLVSTNTLKALTGDNTSSNFLIDPQVIWDPGTSRFYYVVLNGDFNTLDIGFSTTGSPGSAGDWCRYFVPYGSLLPDYPKLGDTSDFWLIGVNAFNSSLQFVRSDVNSITKPPPGTACPAANTFGVAQQSDLKHANGDPAVTPVPANATDSSGTGWVVATDSAHADRVTVFKVTNGGGSPPTPVIQQTGATVPITSWTVPPNAPQQGTTAVLDTLDGRLTQAVSAIDPGHSSKVGIWTQHTIAGGAGSEVAWYEIDPSALSLLQSGAASDPSLYVFNGAIAPDRVVNGPTSAFGDSMGLGFSTSSSTAFPAIQSVTKVGSGAQSAFALVKDSTSFYFQGFGCVSPNPCRWGDYSAATPDPGAAVTGQHGSVWFTNAWADVSDNNWRTWNYAWAIGSACAAGEIPVTTSADSGTGSLRQAFIDASALAGPRTICIQPTVTSPITLTSGELVYNAATTPGLTVKGNGVTISGNSASRVVDDTTTGPLTIDGTTITGGSVALGSGGGIQSLGPVTIADSTVSGNSTTNAAGNGGGIDAGGNVTLTRSTVSGNSAGASGSGGGVWADNPSTSVVVTGSTMNGNTASTGGAIFGRATTLTNSTVSGNTAGGGGGLQVESLTQVDATVAGNSAPAAANFKATNLTTFGSVIALPQGGGPNCLLGVAPTSNGYNYSDDASCQLTGTGDRQSAPDPQLGVLGNNGGPTQTRLPAPASPLLDSIPTASCDGGAGITTDQRGVQRPQAASCDVGAVEVGRFYTALSPTRILDTRTPLGGHPSPLGPGEHLDLTVSPSGGLGGVPATGVSAVALNVTVTDTNAASFLTVWPTGQSQPPSSNLNWAPGVTIPNLVQVKVGTGGQVRFFNNAGTTDVVVDVLGWYSDGSSPSAAGYTPIAPARILDTRTPLGGHQSPLGQGQSLDLTATGVGGVPATGVSAVMLNVTVTDTTASSFLTVWPTAGTQPNASSLNWAPGVTIPNQVIATVGASGKVSMFNNAGSTNVIADVVGWYANGPTTGQGITSVIPARILDTRTSLGGHTGPLGQNQQFDLTVAGMGGVPATGAKAVVLNVTVTDTTAASFLTVWPAGTAQPNVSNLNWAAGVTIPNHVVVKLGTGGKVTIFNNAGSTNVVADVMGWF